VLVSLANIEKLYTTTQLLTPATSGLIIPAGTLFSLASIPSKSITTENVNVYDGSGDTTPHVYSWSWLKQPPDIEQLPSGKMVIRQEYWLDLWSTWEYATL